MSEYQRTVFDRHGPVAVDRIRAMTYGSMVFGLTFGAIALAGGRVSFATVVWAAFAGGATAGATLFLSTAVAGGLERIAISGASTPYEDQYSYQDALVMQGKVSEALASYEDIIVTKPNDAAPRIRAAELYAREAEGVRRAAELLRAVQRLPDVPAGQDIYATNRLVDLLVGPLRDPGRAMVELRRLIERYPRTTAAAYAREALARLKQRAAASAE
jgi:hypothetical protein